MKSENTIQHRWFGEVWNKGHAEVIDELMCIDFVGHGLTDCEGNEVNGIESFKTFYRSFRGAIPDIRVSVKNTLTEGSEIMALCHVTGTHQGEGLGVPPTNKKVDFSGMCLMRIRDGQIAEAWNCFDFLSLFQQIGAVRLPAQKT